MTVLGPPTASKLEESDGLVCKEDGCKNGERLSLVTVGRVGDDGRKGLPGTRTPTCYQK